MTEMAATDAGEGTLTQGQGGEALYTGFLSGVTASLERRLEDTTSRFRALIAALPAAVLVEDQSRRIILANDAFTDLFGIPVPPEALLGADCSQAAEESKHLFGDPEGFVASVERVLAGRVLVTAEIFSLRDGRVLERDFVPVRHDEEYLGHMWVYRDITETRAAMQEAASRRAELDEAQRVAHVGSWRWDPVADVVEWSAELREIYGLAADDPTPTFAEHGRYHHPETVAELARLTARCVATGEAYELEFDIIRPDGTLRHLTSRGEPVRDASGTIIALRGTATDITARHSATEALRVSEARANALVEQLRQADAAKNQFISSLAHELRNPLAAVRMALWALRDVNLQREADREALAIVERQAEHLIRLVDDLLDVTRMTRNTVELKAEPVELNELVWRIANDYQAFFDERGVGLEVRTGPAPILVVADPARVMQAVGNLLHNAVKFTPPGGTATLTVTREEGWAVVTVTDTGPGIDPTILTCLFEPFTQADETQRGLGLGLSIVQQVAELHGGTVTAANADPGPGARFVLRFPATNGGVTLPEGADAAPHAARSLRILLVEDELVLQAITVRVLRELGHHATAVGSGEDALVAARQDLPDVVICDIGLPGMSGFEVAGAFRADPRLRDVPLVALSGYAQPHDVEAALRARFDDHLAKPVHPETLARLLAHLG